MKRVTKALLVALALTGAGTAVSAPASAAGVYFGYGSGPYYGGYYSSNPYAGYGEPYYPDPYYGGYADPYACDFYEPPWGYPPDYCLYQTWNEPVYYGGLWYSGPIYYRYYLGTNWFWLNGGWRRDEWRGPRPGRIDWDRNMRWSGPVRHRDFEGRNDWDGRNWNGGDWDNNRGSFAGPDRDGGERFEGDGRFDGRNFGPRQNGGQGDRQRAEGQSAGRFDGRTFGGQNFAPQQNGGGQGGGRFGGRNFSGQNIAPALGGGPRAEGGAQTGGRFGGQNFSARQNGGAQTGGGAQGGARLGGRDFRGQNIAPVLGGGNRGRQGRDG